MRTVVLRSSCYLMLHVGVTYCYIALQRVTVRYIMHKLVPQKDNRVNKDNRVIENGGQGIWVCILIYKVIA